MDINTNDSSDDKWGSNMWNMEPTQKTLKYQKFKTGLKLVDTVSSCGLCSSVGTIMFLLFILLVFLVAPPFVNILNKGEIMIDSTVPDLLTSVNKTLDKIELILEKHDKRVDKLEQQIEVLLTQAMIDANKTSALLDQISELITYIEHHIPFFPKN